MTPVSFAFSGENEINRSKRPDLTFRSHDPFHSYHGTRIPAKARLERLIEASLVLSLMQYMYTHFKRAQDTCTGLSHEAIQTLPVNMQFLAV